MGCCRELFGGLVHRDISPHNLMIGPGGDVKLLDFGIAKATAAADATRTGSLKGKSGYMAPEQCRGERVDRRSDVFALGIVLWELLVGKRLFKREADFASMEAIVAGDYRLPSEVRTDLPKVTYKNGKMHGPMTQWDDNGQVEMKGSYKDWKLVKCHQGDCLVYPD